MTACTVTRGSSLFLPDHAVAGGCLRPGAAVGLAGATAPEWMAEMSWLLFFDPERDPARERRERARAELDEHREERLYCAACRHPITRQDQRISVQGGQEHVFTNPLGMTFHIACFREATGCHATGIATAEHTWFPGYRWRIALCAACETHLGWLYVSGADRFHGLILDRLTSRGSAG